MQKKSKGFFNLETTFEYAVKTFKTLNPEDIALNGGVEYNSTEKSFRLFFLQEEYFVKFPSGETLCSEGKKASLYVSIILLHYLNTSTGTPLAGRWVSFKELPGGQIYIEPFKKRALDPFLNTFANTPDEFVKAALLIGGFHNKGVSEFSMVIPVLPRVPVNFIIHPGDEEFAASVNILFDAHARYYLPTEDYAHLPGMIIRQMTAK